MALTKVSLLKDPITMNTANVTGNISVTRGLAVGYTDGRVPQSNLDVKGNVVIKPDSVAAGASLSNSIVATTKGVSIGGVAPTAKLSVGGTHTVETIGVTAAGGGGRVIVRATTGTLGTYGSTNNIPVNFLVNNNEIMRITSDGLVIGGTSAVTGAALTVEGADYAAGSLNYVAAIRNSDAYSTTPAAGILFQNKYNSGGSYADAGGIEVVKENATDGEYGFGLGLHTRANGAAITEKLHITGAGNVGIGTNTPVSELEVAGNASVTRNIAIGYTDGKAYPAANLDVTGNAVISGSSYPNAGAEGPLWTGRNWIINGTGSVNQRYGTTAQTGINTYAMDRWRTYGGALGYELKSESEARTVADSSPDGYYISFRRTDSQTNNTGVCQGIETKNSKQFAGRTACLSFKARKGANFSEASSLLTAHIRSGEGTDENPVGMTNMATASKQFTLTTTWQKFIFTTDIATDKTQLTVDFAYTPVGTVGADDSFDFTEVQLEIGSEPTPFEQEDITTTVAKCQRYFNKSYALGTVPGTASKIPGSYATNASGTGNGEGTISVRYPVEMRATATVTFYSPADGAAGNASMAGASNQGLNTAQGNSSGFYTSLTGATSGQQYFYHYQADSEL